MRNNTTLRSYLYNLFYKYKFYLISMGLIAICASLFNVFVNYQVKQIIDGITSNHDAEIWSAVALFTIYKAMHHGFYFIGRLLEIKYKPAMLAEVIENAYTKAMEHSLHWFDSHLSGEIASKITDFQDSIMTLITISYRSLANIAVIVIGILFLLTVHYLAASVLIMFVLVYAPLLGILLKKQMRLQEEYAKARQESIGIINDSISNIFGIKIIGNVLTELRLKLLPSIVKWSGWDKKTRQYDAYYVDMADTILITIMGAVQIALLAFLYRSNQISAGDFAFITMVTLGIHKELDSLLESILFSINPKIAIIKSSYNFINAHTDMVEVSNAVVLPTVSGEIRYNSVTFCYDNGADVFKNLQVHIKSGERVGIVGTSGAGKTTFIKCLLRYFALKSGNILIDKTDIAYVTEESLRANISVIPQDITLFHRSILENLQLAKYDASFDAIQGACKKARIHDDIMRMASGYDSIVGERGVKLSGGQRQRIAIARAILKDAPILILDEATSALDTPTEKLIQESINEMLEMSKATTIVIAHRLSTLLHMDRILVFDKGNIVEDGTHTELLTRDGLYKILWDTQVGGFLPDKRKED